MGSAVEGYNPPIEEEAIVETLCESRWGCDQNG